MTVANATAAKPDRDTLAWRRDASDDAAIARGCKFSLRRAVYAAWWIERYCKLYEGVVGEPLILRGCHKCGLYDTPVPEMINPSDPKDPGMKVCLDRAKRFARCVKAKHPIDWQYECTMRVFGWQTFNELRQQWVRRFREAIIFIGKKNKKSPTMAAWGMYLLAGDEEPGQKVFLCAKDGMQVRANGARHCVEMVRQSPELAPPICTINKVEMRITHEPSRSVMIPLSSSNERTQKSKEGLNGSVLVDEVHVVDREFMNVVSRAGISRAEPLHAEFSTAGDDPDSYGKARFDLAIAILRGEEPDRWRTFAAVYAAPQDLKDADLERDPLKYGRLANPAMGHTVDPAEFMEDYHKSRKSPANFATFKMYRLDIWQNAASPWLSMVEWQQGETNFRAADFDGRECWAALDLSQTRDFSALTLCFPEGDDVFSFLWWFWYPEDRVPEVEHLIPIRQWLADPRTNLLLTPGNVIDYGYITGTFRKLAKRFDIQELAYDGWNAEKDTQEIEQGRIDDEGKRIEEGTGVPRLKFSQALQAFNEPTKKFEVAVAQARLRHNGDPLATWMAGNATIKPDTSGNYKPMKPRKDSIKKIDGIVTAVMAFWRASAADSRTGTGEFYESHELEMA